MIDHALVKQMPVIQTVKAPVGRFLPDESLDLILEKSLLLKGKLGETSTERVGGAGHS